MTNVVNLGKLINHLKVSQPQNFDMGDWLKFDPNKEWRQAPAWDLVERLEKHADCGTVACVAGHAALLKAKDDGVKSNTYAGYLAMDTAREWLDLTEEQAQRLFLPRDDKGNIIRFTLDDAIDTLKLLRETGDIQWNITPTYYGDDEWDWNDSI